MLADNATDETDSAAGESDGGQIVTLPPDDHPVNVTTRGGDGDQGRVVGEPLDSGDAMSASEGEGAPA